MAGSSSPRLSTTRKMELTRTPGSSRRRVTDVEEAAAKAHIDEQALGQARADLGIVTSRSNAGGA